MCLDMFNGAHGRNRTCDPTLRRRVLYPLSYEGGGAILTQPQAILALKRGGVRP